MKRSVVMLHKLTDTEVKKLCYRHEDIQQETTVDNLCDGICNSIKCPHGTINLETEEPDSKLEIIVKKEELVDWHQEPLATLIALGSTPSLRREVKEVCVEGRSGHSKDVSSIITCEKEVEVSSNGHSMHSEMKSKYGACRTNNVHQRSAEPSQVGADSLQLDLSGRSSKHEVRSFDKILMQLFLCAHCDYSTNQKDLLKLHLGSKHQLGLNSEPGGAPNCGNSSERMMTKTKVPDSEVEDITVKEEPTEWHQESQHEEQLSAPSLVASTKPDSSLQPPKKKGKITCPLCGESVFNIAAHVRSRKHGWTPEKSKYAKAHLGLKYQAREPKRVRKEKNCPHCFYKGPRLDQHLRIMHPQSSDEHLSISHNEYLLETYGRWCRGPDSGPLTENCIKNMLANVRNILCDKSVGNLMNLTDEVRICSYFQGNFDSGLWDGEICATHLFSLKSFYKFLVTSFFRNAHENHQGLHKEYCIETVTKRASTMRECVERWARYYKEQNKTKELKRCTQEETNMLTQQERLQIKKGNLYKQVRLICIAFEFDRNIKFVVDEFIALRNYLIVNIFVRSARRAELVTNLRVEDFRDARFIDDRYVIEVAQHKTKETHGDASIIVDDQFYRMMKVFESMRHNLLLLKCVLSEWYFITISGFKLNGSGVTNVVKFAVKIEGITKDVTTTIIQKCPATEVTPDVLGQKDVSRRMTNSTNTTFHLHDRRHQRKLKMQADKRWKSGSSISRDSKRKLDHKISIDSSINMTESEQAAQLRGPHILDSDPQTREMSKPFIGVSDLHLEASDPQVAETSNLRLLKAPNSSFPVASNPRFLEASNPRLPEALRTLHSKATSRLTPTQCSRFAKRFKQSRNRLFSSTDTELLIKIFEDIISSNGALGVNVIKQRLQRSAPEMLKKFDFNQLSTRLYYLKRSAVHSVDVDF